MLRFFLLLLVPGICLGQPASLPADFRAAMAFIPADAESLMATLEPYEVPALKMDVRNPPPFAETVRAMFLVGLLAKEAAPMLAELQGRTVLWAMAAKRRQEVRLVPGGSGSIELGVHPYEGVALARFREPLPATFVARLPYRSKSEPWAVILAAPDTLAMVTMLTSDDAMLRDVAARIAAPPGDRAFAGADVPWSNVRLDSTIWSIRRTPGREVRTLGQWVFFSHDAKAPQVGWFRNMVRDAAAPESPRVDRGLGATVRHTSGSGYIDTTMECLPEQANRCLAFPFFLQGFGIMIYI